MADESLGIDEDLHSLEEPDVVSTSEAGENALEKLPSTRQLYSNDYARATSKEGYEHGIPSEMRSSRNKVATEKFSTANDRTPAGGDNPLPNINGLLPSDTTHKSESQTSQSKTSPAELDGVAADNSKLVKKPPVEEQKDYSAPLPLSLYSTGSSEQRADKPSASADPFSDFHKQLVLRNYQKEVARKVLIGQNDIILLPTGTGKTYVAIKVIIEHLYERRENGKKKVVFFVPTAELAIQQLKKIQDYLPYAWDKQSRMIIGDINMPMEQVIRVVKEDQYVVLVVTPAIIGNYFSLCKDASLSDFSLLIFDEYHHAKKDHPYNELIRRCLQAKHAPGQNVAAPIHLPQMIGMTATIGIGDANNLSSAKEFIIGMCAKFGLDSPPSECREMSEAARTKIDEELVRVESRRRDGMSNYLQNKLMQVLEQNITAKLTSDLFVKHEVSYKATFPEDRYAQTYEQYLVNLRDTVTQFHAVDDEKLHSDINYCMVAIIHLLAYYKTIQLVNLLYCEHGLKYLEELKNKPEYQGIEEIWSLFLENFPKLQDLASEEDERDPNRKVLSLRTRLEQLFTTEEDSKVIIFVQMRVVAYFLAELLNKLNPTFKAREFTSTGPSAEDGGMKPQQRFDAREGFEGGRYNILVATSVLEEGIDIQACNMVIRYMYVKDMIAKIQSRGRARHERGVLVAMLDEKLLDQERKNNFRENMMFRALEEIRALPREEFQKQVASQLKSLTPKKAPPRTWRADVKRTAKISCKSCGLHLGDMNDVRKFGQSHFLILDSTLSEKVKPFPDPSVMKAMDGMVPYGRLNCKGAEGKECGSRVGTLMKMSSGHYFGMWYIKGITVNNAPLKKYKDVLDKHAVEIQPVYNEDLLDVAPDVSFPEELLQPTL